jgi:hypothetical protein
MTDGFGSFTFFFFWWGLLHGPQQGPDRMKEKTYKTGKKENSCLNRKTLLEKPQSEKLAHARKSTS